jgi:hypothetical protein
MTIEVCLIMSFIFLFILFRISLTNVLTSASKFVLDMCLMNEIDMKCESSLLKCFAWKPIIIFLTFLKFSTEYHFRSEECSTQLILYWSRLLMSRFVNLKSIIFSTSYFFFHRLLSIMMMKWFVLNVNHLSFFKAKRCETLNECSFRLRNLT